MKMKRIINTLAILAASILAFSCQEREEFDVTMNESIILDLSSGHTKASDTSTESFVNHLDVFIFKAVKQSDNTYTHGERVYYGRYMVNNASSITLNEKRSSFDEEDRFYVYLVANANLSQDNMDLVMTFNGLQNEIQKDEYIHLTGLNVPNAPKYFLMDAVAKDSSDSSPVQLFNGVLSDNTELTAELKRAAAKVVINISAGADVQFKHFTLTDGSADPESDGGLYYVRNLPYDTYLIAGVDASVIEAERRTTMKGSSAYFEWHPETIDNKVSLTSYVYPHHWSNASILTDETCVIMNLPMIFKPGTAEETSYKNSWYKIPMSNDQMFERNHYYEVNITINRPGATSDSNPQEITDIYYSVDEWTKVEVEVGGEDRPKYLQLNTDLVEMHNVTEDSKTLEFSSSSPITSINLVSESVAGLDSYTGTASTSMTGYYVDKFGQPQQVSNDIRNNINADWNVAALSGGVSVSSPMPANDTPRYMTFEVTNEDGLKSYFTVVQYPVIYITNVEGYYSYRDDFKASNGTTVHYENRTAPYVTYAYWGTTRLYRQSGSGYNSNWTAVDQETGAAVSSHVGNEFYVDGVRLTGSSYNDNRGRYYMEYTEDGTTYRRYYSDLGEVFTSDVRTEDYTSGNNAGKARLRTYYNNNNNWSYTDSKNPGNQRMYHVHLTATSNEYTIARPKIVDEYGNFTNDVENGHTDDSADNSLLVSPSFMIASQLGVTSSVSGANENNYQRALNQCKNYVETYKDENGQTVHLKDWRLPTKAEIDIIADLQKKTDGAVDMVLAGRYYFCASPERYTAGASNYESNGYFIRCIRDVY